MLQIPASFPGHVAILTLDYGENGPWSERQHDLEIRLFENVSDPFFF